MKKNIILSVTNLIMCIVGIVLLLTICSPCPKGMICKDTTFMEIFLLGTVGLSSLTVLADKIELDIIFTFFRFIILIILMPIVLVFKGGCKVMTMRCQTITFPSIFAMLIVLVVLNTIVLMNQKKLLKELLKK